MGTIVHFRLVEIITRQMRRQAIWESFQKLYF